MWENMNQTRIYCRCWVAVMGLLASACGPVHQPPHFLGPSVAEDSAMFALAVERMRIDFPRDSFFVDPNLLSGGPEALDPSEVVDSAETGINSIIQTRKRVLRQMGINSRAIPGSAECPRAPIEIDQKTGCPPYVAIGIVAGLAREGGAYLPDGGYDERVIGKAKGERVMRILQVILGPQGSNLAAFDLVYVELGKTWRLLRSVLVYNEM
jgi:hypothetical protein